MITKETEFICLPRGAGKTERIIGIAERTGALVVTPFPENTRGRTTAKVVSSAIDLHGFRSIVLDNADYLDPANLLDILVNPTYTVVAVAYSSNKGI